MSRARRTFLLAVAAGAGGFLLNWQAACSNPNVDVIFQGDATQSALDALEAGAPTYDAAQAASFTWASNGTSFSASQPLTLCWTTSATARLDERDWNRVVHPEMGAPGAPARGVIDLLTSATEAHADASTTPFTGRASLLVLSTAKDPKLVRVFTSGYDYTPDATTMKKLATAGVPITAVVTTAYFEKDDIAAHGGPFKGNAVSFTMTP